MEERWGREEEEEAGKVTKRIGKGEKKTGKGDVVAGGETDGGTGRQSGEGEMWKWIVEGAGGGSSQQGGSVTMATAAGPFPLLLQQQSFQHALRTGDIVPVKVPRFSGSAWRVGTRTFESPYSETKNTSHVHNPR